MAKRIKTTRVIDAATGEVLLENRQTVFTTDSYIPGLGYRLYARKGIRLGKSIPAMENHARGLLMAAIYAMDELNVIPPVPALVILTGLSKRRIYQLLEQLKELDLVAKDDGNYLLSPAVAFSGIYLSPHLYRLFQKELDRIVPGWAKTEYAKEAAE